MMSVIGNLGRTALKKFAISLIFTLGIKAKTIITTIVQIKKYNAMISMFSAFRVFITIPFSLIYRNFDFFPPNSIFQIVVFC